MKTLTSIQGLEERIEQLVREHIEASRAAAAAAVARAFTEPGGRSSTPTARRTAAAKRRPMSPRRTPEEVADLAERLCAAVHAAPGKMMATLAAEVGATPRELGVAVAHLRRADRVRTVGQRQSTRYFPAAQPAQEPAL